ncbi:hypothetical protein HPB50_024000 [Hyalomma asiaticum]|uniref:Uncharacterized protein n=1 Tax=Hyalomma asiaticum TaxID=266040 RepID=A0ACB7S9U3_HYAAI|nr:hypothetical protein HPB50_024000 [Hyalomma asiaticum]
MEATTAPTNGLFAQDAEPFSDARMAPAGPIGATENNSPKNVTPECAAVVHGRLDNSVATRASPMDVTADGRGKAVQESVAMSCGLHARVAATDIIASAPTLVTTEESAVAMPVAVASHFSVAAVGGSCGAKPAEEPRREAPDVNRATALATVPFVAGVCPTAVPSPTTLSGSETAVIVAPDNVGTAAEARRRLYMTVAVTYMAALSFGLSIAYSSPALPGIRKAMEFSDRDSDWFGSLVTLGAVIGGLSGGKGRGHHKYI